MNPLRWGAVASFALAVVMIVAPLLYLTSSPNNPEGLLGYRIADLLYGPVLGACFAGSITVIKVYVGQKAPRRMNAALIAAALAALAMVVTAALRSSNRAYFLEHNAPMVAGMQVVPSILSAGKFFLGWSMILMGSASWSARTFPRPLAVLAMVAGTLEMLTFTLRDPSESPTILLTALWAISQGIVLWWKGSSGAASGFAENPQTA